MLNRFTIVIMHVLNDKHVKDILRTPRPHQDRRNELNYNRGPTSSDTGGGRQQDFGQQRGQPGVREHRRLQDQAGGQSQGGTDQAR